MIEFLTAKVAQIQTFLLLALVLFAIIFVISVFVRTKSLVPTLVALVTAGVVLWGANNLDWFKTHIQKDTNGMSAPGLARPEAIGAGGRLGGSSPMSS